jgi:putative ABC transport system substrate-binding protein
MRRREFIAAAALPLLSRPIFAQQSAAPTVGFLGLRERQEVTAAAILRGLSETGYIGGKDVEVVFQWGNGQHNRLAQLAAELLTQRVSVIIADGTTATLAAKAATSTIPIVFNIGADPVALGLVRSLGRPGANVTGVTSMSSELAPKGMELLHELVPTASDLALLVDPNNPEMADATTAELQAAAQVLGLRLHVLSATSESDFEEAFAVLNRMKVGGLLIVSHATVASRVKRLADLALIHKVPTMSWRSEFVLAGGLASFGSDRINAWRQAGNYAGRILKGAKPAELPVERQTRIALVLNLRTAKAMNIKISPSLLARADEVIE